MLMKLTLQKEMVDELQTLVDENGKSWRKQRKSKISY